MDKHIGKTSFCKWIAPVSFENLPLRLQEQIGQTNTYVKKLYFDRFLKLMLHAVSSQKASLRDIEASLLNPDLQAELGFDSLSSSQISRKIRGIKPIILEEMFHFLVSLANQGKRNGKLPKAFIVDSTTVSLNKTRYPWAEFRTTKSGIKLHLRLAYIGKGDAYPDRAIITNASVHDVNRLEIVVDEKLATYIFDRGYLDFEMFDKFSHDEFFFVSRIRKNTLVKVMEEYEVPSGGSILQDQMVVLGGKNGYLTDPYRLVEVTDTQENRLRIITNRFDLSAEAISQMYRSRWEIELFFKQLKQQTTIKKFFSRDEDGLKNQVYLALIAQLLTYLVKLETQSVLSSLTIQRYLFASLWEASELWETRIRGKPTESK